MLDRECASARTRQALAGEFAKALDSMGLTSNQGRMQPSSTESNLKADLVANMCWNLAQKSSGSWSDR
jgi:hypothetical protein